MLKKLFKKSNGVEIHAPLNGKVVNLKDVPDPVFSQKMMGEGIAIVPSEGKVFSPVNGEIVTIPESKHAIGLRTKDGTEVLIHIGLETVSLNGKGFTTLVSVGDQVKVGEQLLDVDLEYIKENAADIITPVIITNSNDKQVTVAEETEARAGETVLLTVK